jgi:hypothetical protein
MVTTEIKSTFALTAYSAGAFAQMMCLAVKTVDNKLEILFSSIPPRRGGKRIDPVHPEEVELREGESLCRLLITKAHGLVRFKLSPLKGKAMPFMHACPPLAITSNPAAARMIARFINRKVVPDLAIVAGLREAVPAEAALLFDEPQVRRQMRKLPPPVREALLEMNRMVADIRGVAVTGERIAEYVDPQMQVEAADEEAIQDLAAVLGDKYHI